jgi:hypothetical protein
MCVCVCVIHAFCYLVRAYIHTTKHICIYTHTHTHTHTDQLHHVSKKIYAFYITMEIIYCFACML